MPKPRIAVLTTGGTIVSVSSSALEMNNYGQLAGFTSLSSQDLLASIPGIEAHADITVFPVTDIGSARMGFDAWIKIVRCIEDLDRRDSADGFVITHGTDTLEETAYFLSLVLKTEKPVVLTGAMRPSTGLSADGPMNLLNAVRVAVSKDAVGKGVLIAMNDTINGARDATKTNTTNMATFKAPELGALGYIAGGKVMFYKASTRRHTAMSEFNVKGLMDLPRVDIVYSHANADGVMVDAAVKAGAKGIIHDGTGNGSIHKETEKSLIAAQKKGLVIVRSSRVGNGPVVPSLKQWTDEMFLDGDTLNAQKARLLLQLALTKTNDLKEIQRIFNEY